MVGLGWRMTVVGALLGAHVPAWAGCETGDVVLNEFLPDPAGADGTQEWVELFNAGASPVDLEGWVVEAGTQPTNISAVFTVPSGVSIAPGAWVVLAGATATTPGGPSVVTLTPTGSLGNAGSNSDVVQLRDCPGTLLDVVAYGSTNASGQVFTDEAGADILDARLGPKPASDRPLARVTDGADTDDGSVDFVLATTATPAASNGTPPVVGECDAGVLGDIVINEFLVNPDGTDSQGTTQFVELYKVGATPVVLEGWSLGSATRPDSESELVLFGEDDTLEQGEFLLVGGTGVVGADVVVDGLDPSNGSGGDLLVLRDCEGTRIDGILHGGTNDDGFAEDDGDTPTDIAPTAGSDVCLARRADGADSDASVDDVVVASTCTPGAANPVLQCASVARTVVVNEIRPNPDGADGTPENDREFVELYNVGSSSVDVTGWTLGDVRNADDEPLGDPIVVLPDDSVVPAGGYLVVGGALVTEADVVVEGLDLGSGSGGDGVVLVDCEGERADALLYGGDNEAGLAEDDDTVPELLAPSPGNDDCLARREDGLDSDRSVDDVALVEVCTPGDANPDNVCRGTSSARTVKINEFMPNPAGSDSDPANDREWVEITHVGQQPIDVGGWTIEVETSVPDGGIAPTVIATLPAGSILQPGEFLVVGGVFADVLDVPVDGFELPSGSKGDLVVLRDCAGVIADRVIYGGDNEDGLPEDGGDVPTQGAGDPDDDQCVARIVDGVDSGSSAEDFQVTSKCTPGVTNVEPDDGDTGGDDTPAGGCSCGGGASDQPVVVDAPDLGAREPGACRTAPGGRLGGVLVVALLAALRRRPRRA